MSLFVRRFAIGGTALAVIFLLLVSWDFFGLASRPQPVRRPPPAGVPADLATVWEAYQALQERYVDRQALDKEKLAEAAVRGMVQALNDPFTNYYTRRRYQESIDRFDAAFEGIGAQVGLRDGKVTIVTPLPDSPAERAGLRAGDVIIAIEGDSISSLTLDEVIDRIRGPRGTAVQIRIQRADVARPIDLRIVRGEIKNETVVSQIVGPGIAWVRLLQFSESTGDDLARALDVLKGNQVTTVRGLILDLRNNPGGLLRSVVDVASQFLTEGLVVYEVYADGYRADHPVGGGGRAKDIPLVVLVNGGSASGSEVLAGALQDHRRAPLIGEQTFGKGVVNIPVGLSDGSGLLITTARWYTPSGRQIGRTGITPDILVPRSGEDIAVGRDPQLETALAVLRALVQQRSIPATEAPAHAG